MRGDTGEVERIPRGAIRLLLRVVLIAWSTLLIVPLPFTSTSGGEFWWPVALHVAFLEGLRFGTDLVFTFGPYGLIAEGYHPDTLVPVLLARFVCVAIALFSFLVLTRAEDGGRGLRTMTVFVGLPVVAGICGPRVFFLWFPFMLFTLGAERSEHRGHWAFLVLMPVAALLGLVKFSFTVMLVLVVLILTAADLADRRRPYALGAWLVPTCVLWFAAGQGAGDIVPWISRSIAVTRGYMDAMVFDDPVSGLTTPYTLVPFAVAALAFIAVTTWIEWRQRKQRALVHLIGWCGLTLLLLKAGFVRADFWHVVPAVGALFLAQLTWFASFDGPIPRKGVLILTLPSLILLVLLNQIAPRGLASSLPTSLARAAENGIEMLSPGVLRPLMEERWVKAVEEEQERSPLPRVVGDVDAYPSPVGAVFAPGANYKPRPVIRSHETFSSELADLNLMHLENDPSETVLFSIDPVDGRLPSLEEGESWPLLISRYAMVGRYGDTILLSRRARPTETRMEKLGSDQARLGQPIEVPESSDPVFASIEIEPTYVGQMLSVLFRPSRLAITTTLPDGSSQTFRFVGAMAEKPILVSPLVRDLDEFVSFAYPESSTQPLPPAVSTFTIHTVTGQTETFWAETMRVSFYRLKR